MTTKDRLEELQALAIGKAPDHVVRWAIEEIERLRKQAPCRHTRAGGRTYDTYPPSHEYECPDCGFFWVER